MLYGMPSQDGAPAHSARRYDQLAHELSSEHRRLSHHRPGQRNGHAPDSTAPQAGAAPDTTTRRGTAPARIGILNTPEGRER